MKSDNLFLGYDAREMWVPPAEFWSKNRRQRYLLKPEVTKPLSTDSMVWPSVFDADHVEIPAWVGPVQSLWENLEGLEDYLKSTWGNESKPHWIIAISLVTNLYDAENIEYWHSRIGALEQPENTQSWELLGYDVSDPYLLSGLTNCGYTKSEEDAQAIHNKYLPYLNEFHLFNSVEPASEFEALSDERVKEHAPFFVYAIWLVRKEG